MLIRSLSLMLALAGPAALAQQSRQDRAQAFTLDSVAAPAPTPSASATPAADTPPVLAAPALPESAGVTAPAAGAGAAPSSPAAPGLRPSFTVDTPIADLIADPAARAVLDKDLPGLSSDENLDKFAKLGLRQFQPLTGGQMTDALLVKVARDLAKLSGPMLAPVAPATGGTSRRNRDASR